MQILNGQPYTRTRNGKIAQNCFYTKCDFNSRKLGQYCMLWQKLHGFTNLSKLHKNFFWRDYTVACSCFIIVIITSRKASTKITSVRFLVCAPIIVKFGREEVAPISYSLPKLKIFESHLGNSGPENLKK